MASRARQVRCVYVITVTKNIAVEWLLLGTSMAALLARQCTSTALESESGGVEAARRNAARQPAERGEQATDG